jgi:membrane-associated phospholipid phosphatase
MKAYRLKFIIIIVFLSICLVKNVHPQSSTSDSTFHPYNINYWVTGSILTIGATTNLLGISKILSKVDLNRTEIEILNKDIINNLDSWALKQDPVTMENFEKYSDVTLMSSLLLPGLLLFDKKIMHDKYDILLLYLETMSITTNIFEWSFLGPTFQNRLRPVVYYDQLSYEEKMSGHNRNSFYSGHVASVAASTFFMAKVFSDYNPGIGNNKYLLYAAATIPPLLLGYFRIKALKHFPSDVMVGIAVGALCGVLIPELHRINSEKISVGMFSSFEGIGLSLNWKPDFLNNF